MLSIQLKILTAQILNFLKTIKYKKLEKIEDENGSTSEQMINIEKQTTPDRLTRVPWDEEATWEIIG